jgi:hypothetical protein
MTAWKEFAVHTWRLEIPGCSAFVYGNGSGDYRGEFNGQMLQKGTETQVFHSLEDAQEAVENAVRKFAEGLLTTIRELQRE